ncbi:dual specificity protein phosphatase 13 isoform X4 [Rhinopithecus roxellana]|uniref:dual specificity protein phosphatase 13 isoform X4 n=1 Tax=Rhinopithecus bieti TaxID=61621 RepID=UPI00083C4520|nr:PREDICTED: dual specificity protein phosphatase 13 isoform X4 [Rhinopithecus bieti]XP_030796891.1 dual specificity protein phosphatase 13 isoform X4 [Rhinopithecus roxellana]
MQVPDLRILPGSALPSVRRLSAETHSSSPLAPHATLLQSFFPTLLTGPALRSPAPHGLWPQSCLASLEWSQKGWAGRKSRGPSEAAAERMDSLQKQDLRRPKIHGAVRASPYQPPTLASLQRLLWVRQAAMLNHIDEVWPSLFLGDAYAARDKSKLTQLGITHVVNAAAGKFQVDTGAKFYRGMSLEYYGIEADDNPFFDLSVYFLPVARYIRAALSIPQGRVLVHCAMGISRSATLVLAFLMIYENMTLVEAIQTVQAHRNICPNSGFLRQLQVLDNRLGRETGRL